MINICSTKIKNYKEKGWCILKLGFNKEELLNYQKKVEDIEFQAKKINYKPGRIYFDFIQNFNLAAVEAPLSPLVCNNDVYDFFQKAKLGEAIKKIMGWENTICTLIRLFCMGNYNYSGHWHQDLSTLNTGVQVSIIFKDESGFKLLKKQKHNEFFEKEIFKKFEDHAKKHTLPIVLKEEYYDSVNLEAGDVFLFDPSLLHKGSSNHKRLQFHMRFLNFDINKTYNKLQIKDFDFFFDEDKTFNFLKSENEIIKKSPTVKSFSNYYKLKNTINYYFPIFNILYFLKQYKLNNKLRYELFSNTAYQKKNL